MYCNYDNNKNFKDNILICANFCYFSINITFLFIHTMKGMYLLFIKASFKTKVFSVEHSNRLHGHLLHMTLLLIVGIHMLNMPLTLFAISLSELEWSVVTSDTLILS